MSQSTVIIGAIAVAFIAWVVLQGHLGNYLADFGLGTVAQASAAGGAGAGVGGTISAAAGGLNTAAQISTAFGSISGAGFGSGITSAADLSGTGGL